MFEEGLQVGGHVIAADDLYKVLAAALLYPALLILKTMLAAGWRGTAALARRIKNGPADQEPEVLMGKYAPQTQKLLHALGRISLKDWSYRGPYEDIGRIAVGDTNLPDANGKDRAFSVLLERKKFLGLQLPMLGSKVTLTLGGLNAYENLKRRDRKVLDKAGRNLLTGLAELTRQEAFNYSAPLGGSKKVAKLTEAAQKVATGKPAVPAEKVDAAAKTVAKATLPTRRNLWACDDGTNRTWVLVQPFDLPADAPETIEPEYLKPIVKNLVKGTVSSVDARTRCSTERLYTIARPHVPHNELTSEAHKLGTDLLYVRA